jgi:hypothetical protein
MEKIFYFGFYQTGKIKSRKKKDLCFFPPTIFQGLHGHGQGISNTENDIYNLSNKENILSGHGYDIG